MINLIGLSAAFWYAEDMKPTVPEKGTVYRLDGRIAQIMMETGKSCRGCGMAKIGLCKTGSGTSMFLSATNDIGAGVGDVVEIGLTRSVKIQGYFLAYIIPLFSFLFGAFGGHVLGVRIGLPWLDAAMGFVSLAAVSLLSFRLLRKLDRTHRMEIKRIVMDGVFNEQCLTDEERRYIGRTA